jgi:ribosomal protein L24E
MFRHCNTCNKEFDEYLEGAYYSSAAGVVLYFCSNECAKNYFNKQSKNQDEEKRIQS